MILNLSQGLELSPGGIDASDRHDCRATLLGHSFLPRNVFKNEVFFSCLAYSRM